MLGNRLECQHLERLLLKYVANQIVLMKTLHDYDDASPLLVIEPAVEGIFVPLIDRFPSDFGNRFFRLERIVDDNEVRAFSGKRTTDRYSQSVASSGRRDFLNRLPL